MLHARLVHHPHNTRHCDHVTNRIWGGKNYWWEQVWLPHGSKHRSLPRLNLWQCLHACGRCPANTQPSGLIIIIIKKYIQFTLWNVSMIQQEGDNLVHSCSSTSLLQPCINNETCNLLRVLLTNAVCTKCFINAAMQRLWSEWRPVLPEAQSVGEI